MIAASSRDARRETPPLEPPTAPRRTPAAAAGGHLLRTLALLGVGAAIAGGLFVTHRRADRPHAKTEAPPYATVGPNELRVRPDLMRELAFEAATRTGTRAGVRGFGRIAFAVDGSYAVRSPVAGIVERVPVVVGQSVRVGDVLATVRSSEIARQRADAKRLDATIAADEDAAIRIERLVGEGAASSRELVDVRARLDASRAERSGVRASLAAVGATGGDGGLFALRATASGKVLSRRIAPGERVSGDADAAAFTIGDPSSLVVRAAFPERDAPLLHEGAPCRFEVPALGTDAFEGRIENVVRAVDAKTRTAEIVCAPRSVDPRLAADMTAVAFAELAGDDVVTVPRAAVLLRRDDRVAFVRTSTDTLTRRVVRLGATIGDRVQILEGITAGESIVTTNAVLLDGELDQVL